MYEKKDEEHGGGKKELLKYNKHETEEEEGRIGRRMEKVIDEKKINGIQLEQSKNIGIRRGEIKRASSSKVKKH